MLLQQVLVVEALVISSADVLVVEVEVENSTPIGPYTHNTLNTFVRPVPVRMRIITPSYAQNPYIYVIGNCNINFLNMH